ncbi:Mannosyl-oligosaccharide 1,2-alpha-mannosidase MNS1 [Smittium culicis]|uniref:alpha-1,2-Mannosidase n=1 Tax=Smittium culicis TaxID=133412 RepID=A0A1R1Y047_9FUNG|nr:Mannosyl-oligosaccharide 1,2-alpha-mannosidase MNS1 [Smittium culicis]
MKEEFQEAKDYLANINFNQTTPNHQTSLFESVIRVLGGLLSAYELSGEAIILEKAKDVGESLFPCFNHPSGIPYGFININTKTPIETQNNVAEIGTLQLEYHKLSQLTGEKKYYRKTQKIIDILENMKTPYPGVYPIYVDKINMTLTGICEFKLSNL